jgi:hypothetical protein
MIQVKTEVKTQIDVIKDGTTHTSVFNELNIAHHVVLEEEVESEVLNFEIEC